MLAYSIIMFGATLALVIVSICVYRGHISLIHSYHRTRVKDKAAYGRAMGIALSILALPPMASGILAFFTRGFCPTLILLFGFAAALIPLIRAQKKYNGGIF